MSGSSRMEQCSGGPVISVEQGEQGALQRCKRPPFIDDVPGSPPPQRHLTFSFLAFLAGFSALAAFLGVDFFATWWLARVEGGERGAG